MLPFDGTIKKSITIPTTMSSKKETQNITQLHKPAQKNIGNIKIWMSKIK
ncbi:hypothetical protein [Methanobrevibacter gottschalkii]|nr:hypothetical protein [Methanobrevibacter gottschalkii]